MGLISPMTQGTGRGRYACCVMKCIPVSTVLMSVTRMRGALTDCLLGAAAAQEQRASRRVCYSNSSNVPKDTQQETLVHACLQMHCCTSPCAASSAFACMRHMQRLRASMHAQWWSDFQFTLGPNRSISIQQLVAPPIELLFLIHSLTHILHGQESLCKNTMLSNYRSHKTLVTNFSQ